MTEEKKKSCGRCSHYGCLANQGMWWCNAGHTDNMDADTCVDYDDTMENAKMTTSSTLSYPNLIYTSPYDGKRMGEMAKYKINRAKKNRKKERTIKHGRRK